MDLDEIFSDVDDITEPSCMDRIRLYFIKIRDEDEQFIQLLMDKISGREITWEQPWYQKSLSLTRPLKENHEIENPDQYRTDPICREENDKIKKNWRKFKKKFDLPDKLICLARWRNKDKSRNPKTPEEQARHYVIAYLARGLNRALHQVFKHIMSYFGGSVRGHYTKLEEKLMEICFFHNPKKAVVYLSTILNREPRGIYKRLHWAFHGKPQKKRLKWTLALATKFINYLLEYSGEPLEELLNKKLDKSVWLKLEEVMGQQHIYLQCFWYGSLHVQMFVKEDVKINKLRRRLFKKLLSSPYQIWSDIRWKELVQDFPVGFTHVFIYRICAKIVTQYPNYLEEPLHEVLNYGLRRVKLLRYANKRLRNLKLNEECNLEITQYNPTIVE